MRGWLARLVVSAWGGEGRRRTGYGVRGTATASAIAGAGAGLLGGVQMRLDCVGWRVGSMECIPRILPHAYMLPRHIMLCHAVRCS
jgi:hypothetical protein